ncbi:hypothetical protein Ga0123462_1726 [Mariprofundus ferrinatatus]|uniref:Replication-associated protein ORF2/G2P domain-containing protein n=1 Tax=Mariprofundus ferrinatatus TaxID=1921087 RepID=A0A2K8LCE5_9PROT|nr:hypothetical protein [Mariprofundus ferrinatatus]ATX82574.1 hypothetical protein Ga0123462_1726 [Mariprofundus ferrinatatus]
MEKKTPSELLTPPEYYYLQIFKEDVVYKTRSDYCDIRRHKNKTKKDESEESSRGRIQEFSKKSKYRLIHQLRNSQQTFKQFITLTYPKDYPMDGAIVKSHLNTLLTRLRQEFSGIHYLWVIEAQSRGAPHFHIIINQAIPTKKKIDKDGQYFYSECWSKRWSKITGNEKDKHHVRRGFRIDPITTSNGKKLASYMAKYYSKNEQKEFAKDFINIGRFWGATRGFTQPIVQGVYCASELKWMLKLCFHYANLERSKAGLKRYAFDADRGCSIWGFRKIFFEKVVPLFGDRLSRPYKDLEKPPTLYG